MNLTQLSKKELLNLQKQVMSLISNAEEEPPTNCAHCQSTDLVKNGNARGKQRYKCRSCNTTFSHTLSYSPGIGH